MRQRIKIPTNLTLDPVLRRAAERVAFQRSMSLSQLVAELLEAFCEEGDSFFEDEDEML